MVDLSVEIERRDINQHNFFLFSLFAGMVDMGLINQGVVNELAKITAGYLLNYYTTKNIQFELNEEDPFGNIDILFSFFNQNLNFVKEYQIEKSGENSLNISIRSDLCRICPKGLGGAEIKGTLCIIPHLTMYLLDDYLPTGNKISLIKGEPGIKKIEGNCVITYEIVRSIN